MLVFLNFQFLQHTCSVPISTLRVSLRVVMAEVQTVIRETSTTASRIASEIIGNVVDDLRGTEAISYNDILFLYQFSKNNTAALPLSASPNTAEVDFNAGKMAVF